MQSTPRCVEPQLTPSLSLSTQQLAILARYWTLDSTHCTVLHCTALHCTAPHHARITNVVAYNSPDAPYLPLLYPVAGQLLEAGLEEEQVLCFLSGFAPTPGLPLNSVSAHPHASLHVYISIPAFPPEFSPALAHVLRN